MPLAQAKGIIGSAGHLSLFRREFTPFVLMQLIEELDGA
tara:strand:+ start:1148 stop:1264 length:117 start_codon:yes stop_codon:yes gene_type:complete